MDSSPATVSVREWGEAVRFWQDKYERLYDSHKKLQKVNQGLEEKLLKMVNKFEVEKMDLTRDLSDLTARLMEARLAISELEEENDQYQKDCNIAVRLLQCKPSNFMAHKLNSLPIDIQEKVKGHVNRDIKKESKSPDIRTIKVTVPTLPPTAMVYSINRVPTPKSVDECPQSDKNNNDSTPDYVSAAIMAKVLEERSKERTFKKQRVYQYSPDQKEASTQTTGLCTCLKLQRYCNLSHRYRSLSSSSSESPRNNTETTI